MRRIVARVLLFLLIGALINVAVAWGCAIYASRKTVSHGAYLLHCSEHRGSPPPSELLNLFPAGWLAIHEEREPLGVWLIESLEQGPGITYQNVLVEPYRPLNTNVEAGGVLRVATAGWPLRALQSVRFDESAPRAGGPMTDRSSWRAGLDLPPRLLRWSRGVKIEVLPLVPVPGGFALNTLLFGGLVAVALEGYKGLRGLSRSRRDLCSRCAYPTGTSSVCTECGKPIKPRAGATA